MICNLKFLGIDPYSSMQLVKRFSEQDLVCFMRKLERQKTIKVLNDDLRLVNSLIRAKGTESKKGLTIYKRWYKDTIDEIERLSRDDTIWDRLKRLSKNRTIFDRLKGLKKEAD